MTQSWLDLCDEIDDGAWDDGLDEIARAVASRRDIVARRNARRLTRSLQVGDRVRLTNNVKPRYLEGYTGEVKEIRQEQGAAIVFLDKVPTHSGAGRPPTEGFKQRLLVPMIHLVKLDAKDADLDEVTDKSKIGDDSEEDDEVEDDD